jgi:hypothetical protein
MRLELLDGHTFEIDVTPTEPFFEIHDGYQTSAHLAYYFTTLDTRIGELSMAGRLADVQLWDGCCLEFRGDAVMKVLVLEQHTYRCVLEAIAPFWHKSFFESYQKVRARK